MPYMPYDLFSKSAPILDVATEIAPMLAANVTAGGVSPTTNGIKIEGLAKDFDVRLVVNSLGYTGYVAGTTQWTVTLEASADPTGAAGYVAVSAPIVLTGAKETRSTGLYGYSILELVPNAIFFRVRHTPTGTPGGLRYGAFLTKGATA